MNVPGPKHRENMNHLWQVWPKQTLQKQIKSYEFCFLFISKNKSFFIIDTLRIRKLTKTQPIRVTVTKFCFYLYTCAYTHVTHTRGNVKGHTEIEEHTKTDFAIVIRGDFSILWKHTELLYKIKLSFFLTTVQNCIPYGSNGGMHDETSWENYMN
jgi:hypothetical protein